MGIQTSGALAPNVGAAMREAAAQDGIGPNLPRDAAALARPLVLHDCTVVQRRAIQPDDAGRLRALHGCLSSRAIAFRFFGAMPVLTEAFAQRLSLVDYDNRMAVVATAGTGADAPIIAVVRYARFEPGTA